MDKINLDEIDVVISDNDESIARYSAIALYYNLFIPGWKFEDWLTLAVENKLKCVIGLAYYQDDPIAISICLKENEDNFFIYGHIGFFTEEKYRRMGVGSLLSKKMLENNLKDRILIHAATTELAGNFFETVGIDLIDDDF